MAEENESFDRRQLLKYSALLSVGASGVLAGCSSSSDDETSTQTSSGATSTQTSSGATSTQTSSGATSTQTSSGAASEFIKQARSIDFAKNWKKRRMTSLDEWPLKKRQQIPSEKNQPDVDAWKSSGAIKSQPWTLPKGWKDTPANDVDSLQILNFGSLDFDPATAATHAMFEKKTGIKLKTLAIPGDQAIPKETAFMQAGKSRPQMYSMTPQSISSFVLGDNTQVITPLMSDDGMWKPLAPAAKEAYTYDGELHSGLNVYEASLIHIRPDLLKDQGIDEDTVKKIVEGTWSWDELETAMKAFEGTDVYAWAYRGASRIYSFRDFQKMLYQAGGSLLEDDGTVTINSKAARVALEKMVEWREKGWVPKEVVSYGQGDLADGFLSGQFAMVPVFGDLVGDALSKFKKDKEYKPTLSPKGGSSTPNPVRKGIAEPNGVAVNPNASTGEKLASMLYLDARFSHPSAWFEFTVEGNQSIVKKVYSEAAKTESAPFAKLRQKQLGLCTNEFFPQQRPITQRISQQVQKTVSGQIKPKKALEDTQTYIDNVLGQ